MGIDQPIWHLTKLCPTCEQGWSLALLACPNCGSLIAQCEEEDNIFMNINDLNEEYRGEDRSSLCRVCNRAKVGDFTTATSEQIRNQGLQKTDYR